MRHYVRVSAKMNDRDQDIVEVYDAKKKTLLFSIYGDHFSDLFGINYTDLFEIGETEISLIVER